MRNNYTQKQDEFLKQNVKGISLKELTNEFNEKFNLNLTERAISCRKCKLRLSSGINSGCFKKGHVPFNKGTKGLLKPNKTSFKKGHIPSNYRPIGSERVTKDGNIQIKTKDPNVWQLKHRYIYEQHYGTIPKGYNVMFSDKNKRNFDINNLILVSKTEDLIMNQNKLIYKNNDCTKVGLVIAKIINKSYELNRK